MRRSLVLLITVVSLLNSLPSIAQQLLYRQNSGTQEPLFTISMMDDVNGIAAGNRQAIALTTNGGERWQANQLFGQETYYCSYYNDTSSGAIGGSNGSL